MTAPIFDTKREGTILEHVREGMRVFDADNKELGKVDSVYLGEVSSEAEELGEAAATVKSPADDSDRVFSALAKGFRDELPRELQSRLLQNGFIHVNVPGLLAHNRYVLPDQIVQVTSEGVILKATRAQLLKDM